MNLQITAEELIDKGLWKRVCKIKNIAYYALNMKYMDKTQIITLSESEMKKAGIGITFDF